MEEKKEQKPAPVCGCGKQSKHIVYSTFEYFYCQACKTEVKEQEKPKRKYSWALDQWDVDVVAGPSYQNTAAYALQQAYYAAGAPKLNGGNPYPASQGAGASQPHPAYGASSPTVSKAQLAKLYPNGSTISALPPGIVALKGEKIVCAQCGTVCAELLDDLPKKSFIRNIAYGSTGRSIGCGCPTTSCVRNDFAYGCDEIHIEGRGWV